MALSDDGAVPPDGDSPPGKAELLLFLGVRDYLRSRRDRLEPGAASAEAWDRFNRAYDPYIRALCGRYCPHPGDRDDAAQEVRLRLVQRLWDFEYDIRARSFRGWLATFVQRVVNERSRRDAAVPHGAAEDECDLSLLPDPAAGPEAQYERRRRCRIVREILEELRTTLSHGTYEALVMRIMSDRSITEVAAELRISPSQASDRVSWALRRARGVISGHPEFEAMHDRRSRSGRSPGEPEP